MHTATRIATRLIERVRTLNPRARIAAYGLYAPMNADLLRRLGVQDVIGGEFEDQLVSLLKPTDTSANGYEERVSSVEQLEFNVAAADLELDPAAVAELTDAARAFAPLSITRTVVSEVRDRIGL